MEREAASDEMRNARKRTTNNRAPKNGRENSHTTMRDGGERGEEAEEREAIDYDLGFAAVN